MSRSSTTHWLYGDEGIDIAMLVTGDDFTMGPEDAVKAVQFLQPKQAVLMHYNTFGLITQDVEAAAEAIRRHTACQPVLLKPGETLTVA